MDEAKRCFKEIELLKRKLDNQLKDMRKKYKTREEYIQFVKAYKLKLRKKNLMNQRAGCQINTLMIMKCLEGE